MAKGIDSYIREQFGVADVDVRTPEIQVEGGAQYGTAEVGQWIAEYIAKA